MVLCYDYQSLFCTVMMNKYGKPHEKKALSDYITVPLNKREALKETKAKWVDDLTEVKHVKLKKDTEHVCEEFLVRPLQKHARTEHKMKPHMNRMHKEVDSLYEIANQNLMKVNGSKTKVMLFNTSRKTDFEPLVAVPDGEHLEYVSETKLLGTKLTEDLKISKTHNTWLGKHLRECGC